MNLTYQEKDGVLYVFLAGDVNITNVVLIKNNITDAILDFTGSVMLDLNNVEYIDSSGITLLFKVKEIVEKMNRKFGVVNLSHNVKTILQVSGVEEKLVPAE